MSKVSIGNIILVMNLHFWYPKILRLYFNVILQFVFCLLFTHLLLILTTGGTNLGKICPWF
jgi:hypothetical protein